MIQAVAILITAALVAGGLFAAEGSDGSASQYTAATAPTALPEDAAPTSGSDAAATSGSEASSTEQPKNGRVSPEGYCVASQELDDEVKSLFSGLKQQDASQAESRIAFRDFLLENGDRIDALREQAPPAIQADVRTVVASNLAQAGVPGPSASEQQARAAEQRLNQYEKTNC